MAAGSRTDKPDAKKPDAGKPGAGRPAAERTPAERAAEDWARRAFASQPVGALIPRLVRPAFRRRSPATAEVLADWEPIVGPAIAAVTTPRKLFSGTLTVVCSGPTAMELQYVSDTLMARINGHLGRVVVTRLRFVQDIAPVAASPAPPPRPAVEAAARAVRPLPPGELRDALERLGRLVLTDRSP